MANINVFSGEEVLARLEDFKTEITGSTSITVAELETKLTQVEALAKGRSRAVSYATNAAANAAISAMSNTELQVGDNIYIGSTQVPDWYVAEVVANKGSDQLPTSGTAFADSYTIGYYKLYQLEVEKVDLSSYYTKSEVNNKFTDEVTQGVDLEDNTLSFKNGKGVEIFTVSLTGFLIEATFNTFGMVKLFKAANYTSEYATNDTTAFTPAFLSKVLQNYATLSSFQTLSNTVNEHSSRIALLEADAMEVSLSDGLTSEGIITFTWEA